MQKITAPVTDIPVKVVRCCENRDDFLPYELNYVPDDLKKRARSELFEDEETRIHSLKLLRSLLRDESNLEWQDEDFFLLTFLRARKFDVKRAFHLVKTFYHVKAKRNELYDNFSVEDVKRTLEENTIGFLPYRDKEGCVILVIRATYWNPHVNSLGDIMRALTAALLHANFSPATHIAGIKVIFDFSGFTLTNHLPHCSPTYVRMFAEVLQNCFPARFRAVHIVNEGFFFSYFWIILKQVLTKKIRDRFHFHSKNVKKLHKYFSPSILPAEYEGELSPYDNTEWREKVEEKAEDLMHFNRYGYRKKQS